MSTNELTTDQMKATVVAYAAAHSAGDIDAIAAIFAEKITMFEHLSIHLTDAATDAAEQVL